ncbi:MAG: type II secretion system protein [Clostridia bacterium]|nr:type II secretion system protein [Clostridia bacterium]
MMTKIAHMRENRKANKGFSLVELIIVMAIMVALIAVLAPQYIRYVQRSRNAVVNNAAEDVYTAIKTDYIDPDGWLKGDGTITVAVDSSTNKITISTDGNVDLKDGDDAPADDPDAYIYDIAGVDSSRTVKSSVSRTITISVDSAGSYSFAISPVQN